MNEIEELKRTVIDNGFCIGCGACAFASKENISTKKNSEGKLEALVKKFDIKDNKSRVLNICPFYNNEYNEDDISKELYSQIDNIMHDEYLGYNLSNYAGYVKTREFRMKGSSGGFGSWIASKLFEEGLVDKIIHVKSSNDNDLLFKYQISSTLEEIQEGSKSRYYPIEMSNVLDYVLKNDYKYLFVGIPCYVKAVRQLQKEYPVIKKRIVLTLGLVCGHLKSDLFAKTIAWEMGIHPSKLTKIDFRVKNIDNLSNNYNIKATGYVNSEEVQIEAATKDLFASNWGYGFFKYKACDYCDDVLAETADVTIGDAWLPEYTDDSLGTNIITVRNEIINNLFSKYNDEIHLDNITSNKIYESQSGGFRHRREGLQYRLYLQDQNHSWRPNKRVEASNNIPQKRKKIYETRLALVDKSFISYNSAMKNNDFSVFRSELEPLIRKNNRLYRGNTILFYSKKIIRKLRSIL